MPYVRALFEHSKEHVNISLSKIPHFLIHLVTFYLNH
jgi:hypothetical protein